jgi:hypothetical protein
MIMVRFFDKLKGSFRKKDPSTPTEESPTPHPVPEAPASTPSDEKDNPLATSSPAAVVDTPPSPTPSEAVPEPPPPSVTPPRASRVKIARVRVRRAMRPRPVVRQTQMTEPEDPDVTNGNMTESVSPDPATASEETVKPTASPEPVTTRKPVRKKRQRRIRVVRPKVRVVR